MKYYNFRFYKYLFFVKIFFFSTFIIAQQPELILPVGHTHHIKTLKISPNGKYLLSGSRDKSLKLWDLKTSLELKTFIGHTDFIYSTDFSPDSKYIVSGAYKGADSGLSTDYRVILWDIKNEKQLKIFKGHTGGISSVKFSANGKLLISGSDDKSIKLWDISTGKEIKTFLGHSIGIAAVDFSPNGKHIISGDGNGIIILWDIESGKELKRFESHTWAISSICFSSNGKYILSGCYGNSFRLWNAETVEEIREFKSHKDAIMSVCFSSDDKFILSGSCDKTIKLWDISTGKLQQSFVGHSAEVNSVCFSPDNRYIFSAGNDMTIKMWDRNKGIEIKSIGNNTNTLNSIHLSSNNKQLFSCNKSGSIKYWDLCKGKQARIFEGQNEEVETACSSPDNKHLLTGSRAGKIKLWDISSGKVTKSFNGHTSDISTIAFSTNKDFFISGSWDCNIKLWDLKLGVELSNFNENQGRISSVTSSFDGKNILSASDGIIRIWNPETNKADSISTDHMTWASSFSFDKKYAATSGLANTIDVWDLRTKKKTLTLSGHNSSIYSVCFSPNGKYLATGSDDKTIKLWDFKTGKAIKSFTGHNSAIISIFFTNDSKYIYSASWDNTIKIWDVQKTKEILTLVSLNEQDWMIYTPENYYSCSKNASKLFGFKIGLETFNFEQFDLKYNRPDIVLSRLPNADTTLIPLYYKAYQKRLKKMGIKEEMLSEEYHVPELRITDKEKINYQSSKNELTINIEAKDSKYKLDRINVWVNNISIYGINGIDLHNVRTAGQLSLLHKISIPLSAGENKIDISVLNQAGAESLKQTVYINYTPKKVTKPNLFVIAIGVSKYENNHFNLNYAAKDANDLCAEFLKKKEQFGAVKIIQLLDKDASKEKIKAIKNTLMQSNVEDEVVVFFAGHGLLDENLDYYLALHNMNFDMPSEFGLPYEELENLLDGVPARKKLLLIDACHSGEVDKEENDEPVIVSENTKSNTKVIHRGVSPLGFKKKKKKVGLKNSFELMKELFADLRRGTGAMVISSAGGGEFAFEGEQWKNGVFTYSVIQALRTNKADKNNDGIVQVSELRDFVQDMVKKLTNGKQNPTSRRENLEFDFGIW